ncbi:MAG TPA: PQQ-binding-like beta-propeller repeat protein [Solirubrobacteraceae bacterium]
MSFRSSLTMACACAGVVAGCGSAHATNQTAVAAGAQATSHAATAFPDGDWTEFGYDPQRSDVGPADTGITAKNLATLKARVVHLPGTVDSSPIELHGLHVDGRVRDVIVVTTTYGRTLALDASTGAILWQYRPPDIGSYQGSEQITTATPIADPDRRYVYAASPDGLIHKLSLTTGRQVHSGHWPVSVTFDPVHEKIASALNLSGSHLVVVTGGYIGDVPPYDGHVVLIDRASGRITHIWNSICSNRHQLIRADTCSAATAVGDNAIWGRSGAVVEPGSGRILVATGNGAFNGSTNWGDSVLELSPTLKLVHSWTPADQTHLSANDLDLGSTSPALLGTVDGHSLAVQGGKAGVLSLLDLNRLDGTTGGPSARLGGELQDISSPGGAEVLTTPAVWHDGGRTWMFVGDDSSTAAYTLGGSAGQPRIIPAWQHAQAGTSPVLAGGLLYVYDPSSGELIVYEPSTGQVLDTLPAAAGHWNSPIILGGRIVLPEGNANDHASTGTLVIYHLPGR